ncbi:KH_domain-containing protein [Hexamita inflata]|uniref:KH domain-containing protein n=1 Tax=Hexamita inflata TaxID=28002 RepID=A0AA86PCF8_9EUKA|nr:KH domain-containing protein [Hexamita inflata]
MKNLERQQKQIKLSPEEVPYLIGPRGETVTQMKTASGAGIRFLDQPDGSVALLMGSTAQINLAEQLIQKKRAQFTSKKGNNKFEALIQPDSEEQIVIQLPHGGARYLQATNKNYLDELSAKFKTNCTFQGKNSILIKGNTDDINATQDFINSFFKHFACVACPVANWAVGRIIGKQGDGINRLCATAKNLFGKIVLIYFPDTQQKDGIQCYAIISSESDEAVNYVIQQMQNRLSCITEQAGIISDLLPSTDFSLELLDAKSVHGQMYGQKVSQKDSNQQDFKLDSSDKQLSIKTPQEFNKILQQQLNNENIQMPVVLQPKCFNYKESTVFDLTQQQEVLFKNVQINNINNYSLNQNQTQKQAVDRKFLVLSTHVNDISSAEFWSHLVKMSIQLLQEQFFNGQNLSLDSKIELSAFLGRAVFIQKEQKNYEKHIDLANGLMNRDVSSRFIAGIAEEDYLQMFQGGAEQYAWRAHYCMFKKLWHYILIDKKIDIKLNKQQQLEQQFTFDFSQNLEEQISTGVQLEDVQRATSVGENDIQVRGIQVSLILHMAGFSSSKYDLLLLLRIKPNEKLLENEDFQMKLKQFNEISSNLAYHQVLNQSDEEFQDQSEEYKVIALPLDNTGIKQPIKNKTIELQQIDGSITQNVPGLVNGSKASKYSPIVQQQFAEEQNYAQLIKQVSVTRNGIKIQHTDLVYTNEEDQKTRYVVQMQPQTYEFNGNEDFGQEIVDFVKNVCKIVE